jgi:hypothetical protein
MSVIIDIDPLFRIKHRMPLRHPMLILLRFYFNIWREITIFWISEVPSPIVQSFESR